MLALLQDPRGKVNVKYIYAGLALVSVLLIHGFVRLYNVIHDDPGLPVCGQPDKLSPEASWLSTEPLLSKEYRAKSAKFLSGAVQIPTESFDDMAADPNDDRRFDVFHDLHTYLNASFPLISQSVEYINTYGLLYTVEGLNKTKEPVVLMAHQDVVPVNPETADQWTHEPFSGFIDEQYVWGRGAEDTKSSVVGILEAVEILLAGQWTPERTVLIAYGFDEELDGSRGAHTLAEEILSRYGQDGVYMIIDEGTPIAEVAGSLFAMPSVSEKGYADIEVRIETPGGHSSQPPDHTGIGFMAQIVTALEDPKNAFTPRVEEGGIVASTFGCFAEYASNLPSKQRGLYNKLDSAKGRKQLARLLGSDREMRPFVQTTQAVDVIEGGVKVNALPETVTLQVNHRIDVDSSVAEVTTRVVKLASIVAKHGDLAVVVNNHTVVEGTAGTIYVENGQSIEPAPVAPFTLDDEGWSLLGATTRYVSEDLFGLGPVVLSPLLGTGNTDTVHYWDLTSRIYRYHPAVAAGGGAHTVDEYTSIDSHVQLVVWYFVFLQALN